MGMEVQVFQDEHRTGMLEGMLHLGGQYLPVSRGLNKVQEQ